MLVTDSGLVNERSIAWESLNDVDQGTSEFYNGKFEKPKMQEPSQPPNGSSNDLEYEVMLQ